MRVKVFLEESEDTYVVDNINARDTVGTLRKKISDRLEEEEEEEEMENEEQTKDEQKQSLDMDKAMLVYEEKMLPSDEDTVDWDLLSQCRFIKLVTHAVMEDDAPRRKRKLQTEDFKWVLRREEVLRDASAPLEDLDIKPNDLIIVRTDGRQPEGMENVDGLSVHIAEMSKDVVLEQFRSDDPASVITYGDLRQSVWEMVNAANIDAATVHMSIKDVGSIMDIEELREYTRSLQDEVMQLREMVKIRSSGGSPIPRPPNKRQRQQEMTSSKTTGIPQQNAP